MKKKRIFEKIALVLFIGPIILFLAVLFWASVVTLWQGYDVDRGMIIVGLLLTGLGMVTFTRVLLGKTMLPIQIRGNQHLSLSAIEIVATLIWLVAFIFVKFNSAFLDVNGQVSYAMNPKAEDMLRAGSFLIILMWGVRTAKKLIKNRSK